MTKVNKPRFALVSSKTPEAEIKNLRSLGLKLIDEKFKDSVDESLIYKKPRKKPVKKKAE